MVMVNRNMCSVINVLDTGPSLGSQSEEKQFQVIDNPDTDWARYFRGRKVPNIFKSGDDYADHDNQPAFFDDFPEENVLLMEKKTVSCFFCPNFFLKISGSYLPLNE